MYVCVRVRVGVYKYMCVTPLLARPPAVSHGQSGPADPRAGRWPGLQPGADPGRTLVLHHRRAIRRSVPV